MNEHELTVEVQELDERGRPHGTGQFKKLAADTVILALGQELNTRASCTPCPGWLSTATPCGSTRSP